MSQLFCPALGYLSPETAICNWFQVLLWSAMKEHKRVIFQFPWELLVALAFIWPWELMLHKQHSLAPKMILGCGCPSKPQC